MDVNSQLHAPAALTPFLLDRSLSGPERRFDHGGKRKSPSPVGKLP